MRNKLGEFALCLVLAACSRGSQQAEVIRAPLSASHPLIGAWRIDYPNVNCHEIDLIRQDGTTEITSGEELSGSEFNISETPSSKGFYTWIDKVVRDNGKPDCTGSVMTLGDIATIYIFLDPSKNSFRMCNKEDLNTCFGTFIRQQQ